MPTRAAADRLLAFLPDLERPGRAWFTERGWFQYTAEVSHFFSAVGADWMEPSYQPAAAAAMLADDDLIAQASLDEVRRMLTYCVRSERFSSGAWGGLLGEGRVQAVLRRIAVLRDTLPPG